MKPNKHCLFVLVALFSFMALSVGSAFAQEGHAACPYPFTKTLQASGTFVNVPDMPTGWSSHPHQGIGGTAVNTWSGYTFDLRKQLPGQCCQLTSAKLTVTFKALQPGPCGPPPFAATSANDEWSIKGVQAAAHIFCPAPGTGGPVTKQVTVTNQQVLNSGFLSLFAEDDTEIVSATLVLTGCCVNMAAGQFTNLNSSRSN